MNSKAMSLKSKIKNYAKSNNIAAQVVLQNYMFECFLSRLSASAYRDKFVLKSGHEKILKRLLNGENEFVCHCLI